MSVGVARRAPRGPPKAERRRHLFAQDRTAILVATNQAVSRLYAYESGDNSKDEAV